MKARLTATVILAAAVVFGTSGCNLFAPQATTIQYDASDGVSGTVGSVAVQNAIVISEDGVDGNLLVTFVNTGGPHMLTIQYDGSEGRETVEVMVDENATTLYGGDTTEALLLRNIDAKPGALLSIFFQYGQETGIELPVPVLDGSFEQYAPYVPTPREIAE